MSPPDDQTTAELVEERDAARSSLEEVERLTARIIEAVPGGVVHVTAEGAIQAANAEALRILGLSYDEISKRYTANWNAETVFEDGSPCGVQDYPVTKALMTGEPQPRCTIGVRRPDGELVWAVFSALPLKGTDGKVVGAVATFLDVTDYRRLDDASRASEAKLRSVVASAPDIILTASPDLEVEFINRSTGDMAVEEIIGTNLLDAVNDDDRDRVHTKMRRVLDHGEVVSYEVRGLDGVDPKHWSVRLGPVVRDGEVVGLTAILTNITARKESERKHTLLMRQLEDAQRLESIGRLAGGVAHDFNNLLTVIQGGVDLLGRRLEGSPHEAAIEAIAVAATHAGHLTRQLLAFGRRQTLQPRTLDINQFITEIEDMLRRYVREDVHLTLELATELGMVTVDPMQLERVIVNLAANGRDAMPEGGRLTIRTMNVDDDDGSHVGFEVVDVGAGMDAETKSAMFEPFFTTKDSKSGTGLGLASVHGIVSQSGGKISVRSAPGDGTAVRVMLPRVAPLHDQSVAPQPAPCAAAATGTVLLVEDNVSVRNITSIILEEAGYEVLVAESSATVMGDFGDRLSEIDLLVTDVVMPELSGPKLAEALVAKDPGLKVLFVSGHAFEDVVVRGLLPDEVSFLAKPFTAEILMESVRRMLVS